MRNRFFDVDDTNGRKWPMDGVSHWCVSRSCAQSERRNDQNLRCVSRYLDDIVQGLWKGLGTGNTVFDYSWKFELPNNGFLGGGGSSFTVSGSNEHTTDPINLVELVTTPTTDWVCLHLVLKATFYDINEEKVVTQTLRDAKYYWHKTNVNPPADSGTGQ